MVMVDEIGVDKNVDLYFIESIEKKQTDNNYWNVIISKAFDEERQEAKVVSVSESQLYFRQNKTPRRIRENDYVFYDENSQYPFSNGNSSSFARSKRAFAANYVRKIEQQNGSRFPEVENPQNFLPDEGRWVKSYHINVGHGNCSIIVMRDKSVYTVWMIDCSVIDMLANKTEKKDYSDNLESCFAVIANDLGVDKIKISRFMLTHTHYDHYNGLKYLFDNKYVDAGTIFHINIWYGWASCSWVKVLERLCDNKCMVEEPIRNDKNVVNTILYPDVKLRNKTTNLSAARYEPKVNNSSVVYCINMVGKSMIFPGDLEQKGLTYLNKRGLCRNHYCKVDFYCVSHHGSDNGHIVRTCDICHRTTIFSCVKKNLKYAIIMGRDNAYSGIYSKKVLSDFAGELLLSEKNNVGNKSRFFELNWNTNEVKYH